MFRTTGVSPASLARAGRTPAVQDDLDALVRRVDPDRWLSTRFIGDANKRADVIALYAYDHELARAEQIASNPLIAEIRLTWWREALDEIYAGRAIRGHPVARALGGAARGRGLTRDRLEAMIDARIEALGHAPATVGEQAAWASAVGGSAAVCVANILVGKAPAPVERAGEAWGRVMIRRSLAAGGAEFDDDLRTRLEAVSEDARSLPPAVFPAVAYLTLARRELGGVSRSALGARLRLMRAVVTGRL